MSISSKKKMAIACRTVAGHGGITTIILENIKRLESSGWETHLYVEKFDRDRIPTKLTHLHTIPTIPFGSTLKRLFFAKAFSWSLRKNTYDLSMGFGDVFDQDILSLHNCVHHTYELINKKPAPKRGVAYIHQRLLTHGNFKAVIANSELMKKELISRFHIDPKKIKVIYPAFNPAQFNTNDKEKLREGVRKSLGVTDQQILIGLVTSGDFVKRGVDVFFESLALLPEESKQKIQVLIVGKESNLGSYHEKIKQLGLKIKIQFVPPINDVEKYYHALDIFCYPAHFEEFGMSVQEAMACGVPVLTSRRVGAAELLSQEAQSMLLEAPDPKSFAKNIDELIKNPDLRKKWSDFGIQAVKNNTWDKYFQQTLDIYENILDSSPRQSFGRGPGV